MLRTRSVHNRAQGKDPTALHYYYYVYCDLTLYAKSDDDTFCYLPCSAVYSIARKHALITSNAYLNILFMRHPNVKGALFKMLCILYITTSLVTTSCRRPAVGRSITKNEMFLWKVGTSLWKNQILVYRTPKGWSIVTVRWWLYNNSS